MGIDKRRQRVTLADDTGGVMEKIAKPATQADIEVSYMSGLFLFTPLTADGSAWINRNLAPEPWQWMSGGLAVEHRCAMDIADGMQADGLTVR